MVLFTKLTAEETTFGGQRKGYNEKRKAITTALRVKLEPVWAALKAGQTVNGQKGIEQWCKLANPDAKYPERQFQRIINSWRPPTTSSNSSAGGSTT